MKTLILNLFIKQRHKHSRISVTKDSGLCCFFSSLLCCFYPELKKIIIILFSLVQILVKLCTFVSPAEELAQKDDLQLLFSAITSWCPPHNLPWRRSAGEVLTTISRHGLSVNVVKYIHGTCKRTVHKGHLFLEVTVFHIWSIFALKY